MENEVKVENEVKEEPVKVEKKGNKGLIFVLVLIIITLLGVIGYLAFSKDVFGFKLSKDTNGNTSSVVKNNSDSKMDTIKVASPDERYSEYLKNLEKGLKEKYNNTLGAHSYGKYIYKELKYDNDCYFNFRWTINNNLELLLDTESKYLSSGSLMSGKQDKVKVAENVLDMFLVQTGIGDRSYFLYFLKTDGSINRVNWVWSKAKGVSYAPYYDIFNIKKLAAKNIVYVSEFDYSKCRTCDGDTAALLVDIDGNTTFSPDPSYDE